MGHEVKHGTISGYIYWKCRCVECKAANQTHAKRQYAKRLASGAKDNPQDPRHGTPAFYYGWGCRCERCRATIGAYTRGREPREHGTDSGYQNYGCRCSHCRAAHAEAARVTRRKS